MFRIFLLLVLSCLSVRAETFKVFVLAGQSNMEGKVQQKLLDFQARDEKTREQFAHWRDGDEWKVREDVFIKFLDRKGELTTGFGSPGRTGVELEFGHVIGEAIEEPVLLIKAAWGGHSLWKDFRPPSAGLPKELLDEELAKMVSQVEKRNEKNGRDEPLPTRNEVAEGFGNSYRMMMAEVATTMANAGELFPALAGKTPELAGFVWFQGWNDKFGGADAFYEENLRHLIGDIRAAWKAPDLRVVIGVMGQNGSQPADKTTKAVQDAQLAVGDLENVIAVRTDVLVDEAAEELYPNWKKDVEAWEKTGSDHGYHYYGSAIWHLRMGRAFAEAMLSGGDGR